MSLIKTRCRASRRSKGFSPVGVRLPNPYENVRLCLEFAIYQTHVNIVYRMSMLEKVVHQPKTSFGLDVILVLIFALSQSVR